MFSFMVKQAPFKPREHLFANNNSENIIKNNNFKHNGNSCINAIYRIFAKNRLQGDYVTIGKRIRKRRKELNMSVEELARKVGKDRSTIYRYENGDIGNMPLELVSPMVEALKMTPQELLSLFASKSEWLAERAECFAAPDGRKFNDEETRIFCEVEKYLIGIRNRDDYEENMAFLFALFKQLNK